jgi:2-phosphoglycerate kinase
MKRTIILIGGAPTTGKSTVAQALAVQLNLPWISTDRIRAIMRKATTPEACPGLYLPQGHDVEKFFANFTIEQIVEREMQQGEIVWSGVKELIDDTKYTWKEGFICEGVGVLPHLVARDFGNDPTVTALFLCDTNVDNTRQAVFTRGLWDIAHTYTDDVKEKEVEWVTLYAQQLELEVKKYGYPWIRIGKTEDDLATILAAIEHKL